MNDPYSRATHIMQDMAIKITHSTDRYNKMIHQAMQMPDIEDKETELLSMISDVLAKQEYDSDCIAARERQAVSEYEDRQTI